MHKEMIDRTILYVREKFENEYSGHDWFHTLRVFRTATRIAEAAWRYVGFIPTAQRATGYTEEFDLIFEKEV